MTSTSSARPSVLGVAAVPFLCDHRGSVVASSAPPLLSGPLGPAQVAAAGSIARGESVLVRSPPGCGRTQVLLSALAERSVRAQVSALVVTSASALGTYAAAAQSLGLPVHVLRSGRDASGVRPVPLPGVTLLSSGLLVRHVPALTRPWDVLVVSNAEHLTRPSQRGRALETLGRHAASRVAFAAAFRSTGEVAKAASWVCSSPGCR